MTIKGRLETFFFISSLFLFFFHIIFYYFSQKKTKKNNIAAARLVIILATRWTGNRLFFYGQPDTAIFQYLSSNFRFSSASRSFLTRSSLSRSSCSNRSRSVRLFLMARSLKCFVLSKSIYNGNMKINSLCNRMLLA